MKKKWGVIGSGGIARRRTIPEGIMKADNSELCCVYDVNTAINEEVAKEFGATACATLDELLASDCELIYIATPVNLHCEQTLACAKAGKHVLTEKPLGLTVEEAETMNAACREAGVKLGVGLMMRFHSQHVEALRLVKEGKIGTPVYGRAQLSCWFPKSGAWREDPAIGGGGSLMDMGNHCIDLLEMVFGRVTKVGCFAKNLVHGYKAEDSGVVMLEFDNGAIGTVDSLFSVPDISSKNRLELYGSNGSILAEQTIGQGEAGEMKAYLMEADQGYDAQQARDAGGGMAITPQPVNMYRGEVEAFAQAVIDGAEPPVSGEHGVWSQKVMAACYESARTGQVLSL